MWFAVQSLIGREIRGYNGIRQNIFVKFYVNSHRLYLGEGACNHVFGVRYGYIYWCTRQKIYRVGHALGIFTKPPFFMLRYLINKGCHFFFSLLWDRLSFCIRGLDSCCPENHVEMPLGLTFPPLCRHIWFESILSKINLSPKPNFLEWVCFFSLMSTLKANIWQSTSQSRFCPP